MTEPILEMLLHLKAALFHVQRACLIYVELDRVDTGHHQIEPQIELQSICIKLVQHNETIQEQAVKT